MTRPSTWLLAALLIKATAFSAVAPVVLKVDPPSWWAGSGPEPVQLLVRGQNLAGARLESAGRIQVVGQPRSNAAGTYLLTEIVVPPATQPGPADLKVLTSAGSAALAFEVLAALPATGPQPRLTPDDVVYLLMPDRFSNGDPANDDPAKAKGLFNRADPRFYHGGDLRGVADRLDYLKDLGVTAIWLTPLYDNNDRPDEKEKYDGRPTTGYHGYGAIDYYAVDEHLGTLADARRLVERAHALGLKVIQDQVANHSGPYHPWVDDPPTPTWFNGTSAAHLEETWQTWALQDPHATPALQRPVLEGWFLNILPDLNQNDPAARRYIIQNSLWWLGVAGFDAIRQDTVPYVSRGFWREWTGAVKRQFPHVRIIGEVYDRDPALTSFFQGGRTGFDGIDTGIDTVFDFPLFYAVRQAFGEGRDLRAVPQALAHDSLYPHPELLVTFLGLHDTRRFLSEAGATRDGLMLAQTLLCTTRGIPLLYYGDEVAMEGRNDPDNRRDFPGGFPGDTRDKFRPDGRTADERVIFEHVRQLCRLRRELEPLRRGALVNLHATERLYAFARTTATESIVIMFNNGTEAAACEADVAALGWKDGMSVVDRLGRAAGSSVAAGKLRVSLPARTAAILVPRSGRQE